MNYSKKKERKKMKDKSIYYEMVHAYRDNPVSDEIWRGIEDILSKIRVSMTELFEGKRRGDMVEMLTAFYVIASCSQFIFMNKNRVYSLHQAEQMSLLLDYFTDTMKEASTLLKHEVADKYGSRMGDNVLQEIADIATSTPIKTKKEAKKLVRKFVPGDRKKTRRV
jgi:hypothetical protein